ncbi:MAG: hypothetical protein K2O78_04115 [Muribaculaceae bacterium]|nr:hypothetical protein [Muribaculaceae bacterium]
MLYTSNQLRDRHSVRSYTTDPIPAPALAVLQQEVEAVNTEYASEGVRFVLCLDSPAAFGSFKKSYGFFRNVKNYFVAIVDSSGANAREVAGYAGERLVMAAVANGLGTCFVAATYDASRVSVEMSATESIAFLITVGVASEEKGFIAGLVERMTHRKSVEPEEFYDTDLAFYNLAEAEDRLRYLRAGLRAIAAAPSALNKQPVRVWLGEDTYLHAGLAMTGDYTDIDLGIAKFNFQNVTPGKWEWGVGGRFMTR